MNWYKQALWIEEIRTMKDTFPVFLNPNAKEWRECMDKYGTARLFIFDNGNILAWPGDSAYHDTVYDNLVVMGKMPSGKFLQAYAGYDKNGELYFSSRKWEWDNIPYEKMNKIMKKNDKNYIPYDTIEEPPEMIPQGEGIQGGEWM